MTANTPFTEGESLVNELQAQGRIRESSIVSNLLDYARILSEISTLQSKIILENFSGKNISDEALDKLEEAIQKGSRFRSLYR